MKEDFNFGNNVPTYDKSDYEPTNSCFGMVVCPHCGNAAQCSEIFDTEGNMLPRAGGSSAGASGGGSGRKQNGYPYVKTTDLSDEKLVAKVLAVKENDSKVKEGQRRFSDVIIKIQFKGAIYLFGLKIDNPNFAILQEDFGQDETKWVDREFFLYNEQEEFTGKIFPRAEPIAKKVSARVAEKSK